MSLTIVALPTTRPLCGAFSLNEGARNREPRSRPRVMHYFMDEGGNFIPAQGWAVICSLVLPHKSVGPARREINWISRDWPRKDGELKGGMLQPANLNALVEVLFRHDAILHASAIDMANEIPAGVEAHKVHQCEGITKYLTPAHHPDLVRDAWELRRILERMSNQSISNTFSRAT